MSNLVEMSAQLVLTDLDLNHQQLGILSAELVSRLGVLMREEHRQPVRGSARLVLRIDTVPDAAMIPVQDAPHSSACGPRPHDHGIACHPNCPTCGGR